VPILFNSNFSLTNYTYMTIKYFYAYFMDYWPRWPFRQVTCNLYCT